MLSIPERRAYRGRASSAWRVSPLQADSSRAANSWIGSAGSRAGGGPKSIASGALMVSDDDGATFASVLEQAFVHDGIGIPGRPGVLYAAASSTYFPAPSQRAGIYRSLDDGDTWTRLATTLPHTYMWALAMFPDEPDRLLIATNGDGVIAASDA